MYLIDINYLMVLSMYTQLEALQAAESLVLMKSNIKMYKTVSSLDIQLQKHR